MRRCWTLRSARTSDSWDSVSCPGANKTPWTTERSLSETIASGGGARGPRSTSSKLAGVEVEALLGLSEELVLVTDAMLSARRSNVLDHAALGMMRRWSCLVVVVQSVELNASQAPVVATRLGLVGTQKQNASAVTASVTQPRLLRTARGQSAPGCATYCARRVCHWPIPACSTASMYCTHPADHLDHRSYIRYPIYHIVYIIHLHHASYIIYHTGFKCQPWPAGEPGVPSGVKCCRWLVIVVVVVVPFVTLT